MKKMAKGQSLNSLLADGDKIVHVWEANPTFSLGELTLAALKQDLADLRDLRAQGDALRMQLTQIINDVDTKRQAVNTVVVRARAGFGAVYGPNSAQYKQATATRVGDRKTNKVSKTNKKKPE